VRRAIEAVEHPVEVADVEAEDEVRIGQHRVAAGEVERMARRHREPALPVDHRGAEQLREPSHLGERRRMPAGEFCEDDGPLGMRDEVRGMLEGVWVGLHGRRPRRFDLRGDAHR